MKRYLIISIAACILIFAYYNNQGDGYKKFVSKKDTVTYWLDGTSNIKRLERFINNVEKSIVDRINLKQYTIEGDPVITQLYFNGKNIETAIDASEDKYGSEDNDKILYKTINGGKYLKDDLIKYLTDRGF